MAIPAARVIQKTMLPWRASLRSFAGSRRAVLNRGMVYLYLSSSGPGTSARADGSLPPDDGPWPNPASLVSSASIAALRVGGSCRRLPARQV
jgi:hypothetical protein